MQFVIQCANLHNIEVNGQLGSMKPDDSFPNADCFQHLSFSKPIYKVRGRGGKELLFYTEDVIPSHRVADCTSNTRGVEELPQIPSRTSSDILNNIEGLYRGIPIDVYHDHQCGKLRHGGKFCINSVSPHLNSRFFSPIRWLI